MLLEEFIKQKIEQEGPVSFHDFMELALYHPGLGYYTSVQNTIGKKGDFYTSSNLGSVFGAMIGKQLEEMWSLLGEDDFTIVEFGAGTGMLCHDILDYLKRNEKLYDKLNYFIIEKSEVMREKEKSHLHEKVSWFDTAHDLPEITGCILSNELLDNFAVHQVVMQDELMEVFVDYHNGFIETLKPAEGALKNYFDELNVTLPKGFRTEINLEATLWMKEVSECLTKGFVITIDYGYPSAELYKDQRRQGTLVCYHKHQVNDDPYLNIGSQDITTHVNFSALSHWGLKYGLQTCGLTNQNYFLLGLGFKEYLRQSEGKGKNILEMARNEAFLTHTLLVDMGSKFKVLIQEKGIGKCKLKGLLV